MLTGLFRKKALESSAGCKTKFVLVKRWRVYDEENHKMFVKLGFVSGWILSYSELIRRVAECY